MSEQQAGTQTTDGPPVEEVQRPVSSLGPLRAHVSGFLKNSRSDLMSSDALLEKIVRHIERWFVPRAERAQEFFGPAISGLVGCAVFAVFDRFGVGNMEEGGSFHALVHEVESSLKSPYFLLALFLLALALLMESSDGKNTAARWVIAPFLQLAEHVTMLALGVVWAMAAVEAWKASSLKPLGAVLLLSSFMIGFAWAMSKGARYCRGKYAEAFDGRLGRKVLVVLAGVVLAVAGFADLVHFADKQELAKRGQQTAQEDGGGHAATSAPGASAASTSECASCAP